MLPPCVPRDRTAFSGLEMTSNLPSRLRVLNSQTIYSGKVVQLKVDRVAEPGGVRATREVVCHPGSVAVLPRLADGRVVMVRQYRYPTRQWLWELVAGSLEPGESSREGARRELLEETGYRARTVKLLFDFYSSPGFLSERMFLVEARGLSLAKAQPEIDERIQVGRFTRAQLLKMLRRRQIRDAKTLVAIYWLLSSDKPSH
jgi:ADP-ribose pyrophosphatase